MDTFNSRRRRKRKKKRSYSTGYFGRVFYIFDKRKRKKIKEEGDNGKDEKKGKVKIT